MLASNTSGVRGVSRDKGRWRALISLGGKQRHLGSFPDIDSAAAAYAVAAAALHTHNPAALAIQ